MIRTIAAMGTFVTIQTLDDDADGRARARRPRASSARSNGFGEVEARCTRFDPGSEAMRLTARVGVPVAASAILFEAVRFAVAVAEATGGAFDPTVGHRLETRGFNRDYRTGRIVDSALDPAVPASYRDIRIDPGAAGRSRCCGR